MAHKIHLMDENGRLTCEKNISRISRGPDVACYMVERWIVVPTAERCKICERIFHTPRKRSTDSATENPTEP